jgi:ABC-type multidrug transport system permease subunit
MLKIVCAIFLIFNFLCLAALCMILGQSTPMWWCLIHLFGMVFSLIGLGWSIESEERREKGTDDRE